jgi:hypothetical protein
MITLTDNYHIWKNHSKIILELMLELISKALPPLPENNLADQKQTEKESFLEEKDQHHIYREYFCLQMTI